MRKDCCRGALEREPETSIRRPQVVYREPFPCRFPWTRNKDISFFLLSQLILPAVVLALSLLVLYNHLMLLDTLVGLILVQLLPQQPSCR